VAAGQLGLTGGAQPIFFPKSTKNKYTTSFGSPTAQEICSNYSITRWSFLFIVNMVLNLNLHLFNHFSSLILAMNDVWLLHYQKKCKFLCWCISYLMKRWLTKVLAKIVSKKCQTRAFFGLVIVWCSAVPIAFLAILTNSFG
jgi:hypothetical protein